MTDYLYFSVPCRTLKTERGKGVEGARKDSNFFQWMRNKLYEASLAVANFTAPSKGIGDICTTYLMRIL